MDFYWDATKGKVFLEVPLRGKEFLYVNFLVTGVGSNDIGLDRGQLGDSRIVRFHRYGNKILLIQDNLRFRAESANREEARSVDEAFAQSVLHAFEILTEKGDKALIDITGLLLTDVHGVAEQLAKTGQGKYSLDKERSVIFDENLRNFPKNTEFEALLTIAGQPEGTEIRSVVPSAQSVSVRQRHSFVELPDDKYQKRPYDPRSGFFYIQYDDYATPIGEDMRKLFVARHRLIKQYPEEEMSEPTEPIVYYVDPGTPEPVLSALIEGAAWWNEAFEAAGFSNAFQVKVLPPGADPLDIRYNVIQWVHRSSRGWSYGASVVDPRTGEIIKGHVSLGSLRVRQDFLIAEGLLAPYEEGKPIPETMKKMALARLRQLSAHEVGHTLGLAHNYAASTNSGGSVMDYPHPLIRLSEEGSIDLSGAYNTGIGAWDKVAIQYGYGDFGSGQEEKDGLKRVLEISMQKNYRYITDQDARPPGSAHPYAHLWDNGPSAVDELRRIMDVRATALERFSEEAIPVGSPLANLERTLVPVYFLHRYQVEAAVKLIGGADYNYALRGDGQFALKKVDPSIQWSAVEVLLEALRPSALAISDDILNLLPPQPPGYTRDRESIETRTGPLFDPLAAAETAAQLVLDLMMHPQRCERLYQQHVLDQRLPGLDDYLDILTDSLLFNNPTSAYHKAIKWIFGGILVDKLIALSADSAVSFAVRSASYSWLLKIRDNLSSMHTDEGHQEDYAQFLVLQIDRLEESLPLTPVRGTLRPPDGSPIGDKQSGCGMFMLQCEHGW